MRRVSILTARRLTAGRESAERVTFILTLSTSLSFDLLIKEKVVVLFVTLFSYTHACYSVARFKLNAIATALIVKVTELNVKVMMTLNSKVAK